MHENEVFDIFYAIQTLTEQFGALCVEVYNIEGVPNKDGQLRGYIVELVFTNTALDALEISFFINNHKGG